MNISQWKYIESKNNPADIPSRGQTMSVFLKNRFWFSRINNFEEKIWSPKNPVEMKEVKNKTQKCFFIKITESDWRLSVKN